MQTLVSKSSLRGLVHSKAVLVALVTTVVRVHDPGGSVALRDWLAGQRDVAPGIGQTLAFTPIPLASDAPVTQHGLDDLEGWTLLLRFADVSPAEAAAEAGAVDANLEAAGLGTVRWSSPFRPTIPGTDTYTDELW